MLIRLCVLVIIANVLLLGRVDKAEAQINLCDVQAEATKIEIEQSYVFDALASDYSAATADLENLLESNGVPEGSPPEEVLNRRDMRRFSDLSNQIEAYTLANEWEARRARDVIVIGKLAELAESMAQDDFMPPSDPNSEEFLLMNIILEMRDQFPVTDEELEDLEIDTRCNLEVALNIAAQEVAERAWGGDVAPQEATDEQNLSQPRNEAILAQDFYRLSRLEQASLLTKLYFLLDMRQFRENLSESLGSNWQNFLERGRITEEQDAYRSILIRIDSAIPADVFLLQGGVSQ